MEHDKTENTQRAGEMGFARIRRRNEYRWTGNWEMVTPATFRVCKLTQAQKAGIAAGEQKG